MNRTTDFFSGNLKSVSVLLRLREESMMSIYEEVTINQYLTEDTSWLFSCVVLRCSCLHMFIQCVRKGITTEHATGRNYRCEYLLIIEIRVRACILWFFLIVLPSCCHQLVLITRFWNWRGTWVKNQNLPFNLFLGSKQCSGAKFRFSSDSMPLFRCFSASLAAGNPLVSTTKRLERVLLLCAIALRKP